MTGSEALFKSVYRGHAVTIGHANDAELSLIAGSIAPEAADDLLELWSLIAIRDPAGTKIHALGWRLFLADSWITSPLVIADFGNRVVSTRSKHTYTLGCQDRSELDPGLRDHLAYALRTWGFVDVRG